MKTATHSSRTLSTLSTLSVLAGALCLGACTPSEPGSDTDETVFETITPTITTGDSETDTATTGETTETTGGEAECEVDEDCGDVTLLCTDHKTCDFNPDYCGEAKNNFEIVTPNVVLVLDKSGSMVDNSWDNDADPDTPEVSRWYSLFNVVELIVDDFDASMNMGMVLYPSKKAKAEYTINACLVEATPDVSVGPQQGDALLLSMPPENATKDQIAGGTPARAGFVTAYEHLLAIDDDLPKIVILVTDGAANCSTEAQDEASRFEAYDEALTQVIADAHSEGITTFVVGIDIKDEVSETKQDGNPDATNTFERLNQLAIAGGMPQDGAAAFYDSKNQIELQEALTQISQDVLSCEIALDPVPAFPDFVDISVMGESHGSDPVEDCATEDGWIWTTPEKDTILLCGAACTTFQTTGALDAQYLCPDAQ